MELANLVNSAPAPMVTAKELAVATKAAMRPPVVEGVSE
jgi:hypothetical protein